MSDLEDLQRSTASTRPLEWWPDGAHAEQTLDSVRGLIRKGLSQHERGDVSQATSTWLMAASQLQGVEPDEQRANAFSECFEELLNCLRNHMDSLWIADPSLAIRTARDIELFTSRLADWRQQLIPAVRGVRAPRLFVWLAQLELLLGIWYGALGVREVLSNAEALSLYRQALDAYVQGDDRLVLASVDAAAVLSRRASRAHALGACAALREGDMEDVLLRHRRALAPSPLLSGWTPCREQLDAAGISFVLAGFTPIAVLAPTGVRSALEQASIDAMLHAQANREVGLVRLGAACLHAQQGWAKVAMQDLRAAARLEDSRAPGWLCR